MQADLVLEGGGARGVALGGAVAGLAAGGVVPRRVAGTSAGAITAVLLAAGMPPARIAEVARDLDLSQLLPRRPLTALGAVGRGVATLFELGLHDHRPLKAWLGEQLGDLGAVRFGDVREDDPASSLRPDRRSRLVVVVSDVSRRRRVLLPWDLPDYGLDPDRFRLADAVAASAAIPLVFEPVRMPVPRGAPVAGDEPRPEAVWVDGGLTSNYAVDVFDRTDGRPPRWPTIGVKLSARPDGPAPLRTPRGPLALARTTLETAISAGDARLLDDPRVVARTVFVDAADVDPLAVDLSGDARADLVDRGRRAAAAFLDRRSDGPTRGPATDGPDGPPPG